MHFSDLNINKQIQKAINDLDFNEPTTIQEKAFPVIMSGRDVVGIAQTGTGKTFAFLIPILNTLKFSNQIEPRVLIVVPTRELVAQIVDEVAKLTMYMNIRVAGVYGGANINTQKEILLNGTDILVATPGRVIDLANNGTLRLKNIQKVVIDEMDEMLNLGFRTQLKNILDILPEKRQNLLFSATITEDVDAIIDEFFNFPERVEAAPHGTPVEKIKQSYYPVPNFNTKVNLLNHLLQSDEALSKVLVFTKSKRMADLLFEQMNPELAKNFGIIHSNKSQNQRFNAMKSFQKNEIRGLIATDLVSRGLDISDVTHVINFDLPDDAPNYIHRIGRTGRADKNGIAISFITDKDQKIKEEIEQLMHLKLETILFPENVEISEILIDSEKPQEVTVDYLPKPSIKESQGAFHEKKAKNKKVNLGGSYKRKIKEKYKKPKTKGQKKR